MSRISTLNNRTVKTANAYSACINKYSNFTKRQLKKALTKMKKM